jgi:hypothetical protein
MFASDPFEGIEAERCDDDDEPVLKVAPPRLPQSTSIATPQTAPSFSRTTTSTMPANRHWNAFSTGHRNQARLRTGLLESYRDFTSKFKIEQWALF